MKQIRINIDELLIAMADHSGMIAWFIDLETGELLPSIHDAPYEIEDFGQELHKKMIKEQDRYLKVPPVESSEAFRIMEDFIGSISDKEAQQALLAAISRKRPFRNFKRALRRLPDIREMWFEFHKEAMVLAAEVFLKKHNVNYVLIGL